MEWFIKIVTLFFTGALGGWITELFFRRAVHKKWINPGFLAGPCLPLYGSGLVVLYLICEYGFRFIESLTWRAVAVIATLTVLMTLIEYVTGLVFIKRLNVKLWDYSDRKGNVQGIICPLFSFIWGVAGAIYYFCIHDALRYFAALIASNTLWYFICGAATGVFILDVCYSFNVVAKVRAWAKKHDIIVKYEELKLSIKRRAEKLKQKKSFLFSLHSKNGMEKELEDYSSELER